jgi:cysteinyl-tRNA synthetase
VLRRPHDDVAQHPHLLHYPLTSVARALRHSLRMKSHSRAGPRAQGTTAMVTIRLTNSKTRKKEDFVPIDPGNVRMYVCGPTVYDRAHLGNARPVVVFDTLYRLLRHVYGPDHVTYVRNFTDVDDKINAEALRRQKAGAPGTLEELIHQRTDETIAWYHADMDALGALRPDHEPRATEYIGQMIAMTAGLIASGHAYQASGHVLFRVRSYKDYGKLSGRSVDDMIAGARVEVAPFKEDPMDFVLWKPSSGQEPGWESPWGKGRPGWHIECSAMAHELLGESFDIHGGGLDLQFPHHENEIAQSACAHPHGDFARYWLHNEMLQVEGKKMSKSLGNFFTVRDLLDQGIPGFLIRFVFLLTHYTKPMDWTESKYRQCQGELHKWSYSLVDFATTTIGPSDGLVAALSDDLNTPEAITHVRSLYSEHQYEQLAADLRFLGIWNGESPTQISLLYLHNTFDPQLVTSAIDALLRELDQARNDKNYGKADAIKAGLMEAGVSVRIGKTGTDYELTADFDPAKLEALQ